MPKTDANWTWAATICIAAVRDPWTGTVAEWAVQTKLQLPGSARSQTFDPLITPWTTEPLNRSADGTTRKLTFVKPVQSGGSVVGEILLCYWLSTSTGGDVQYNWENDEKALERWDKRIERILEACPSIIWPLDRHKKKRGMVMFPHCNLTVQGVWQPDNLDSDSIRYQVNEELHNWEPGRLAKAYKRGTAFWNSVVVNISNAGTQGDQLHQAFESGTRQYWEVRCPGCGKYHRMHAQTEDGKAGGLRYDSAACKLEDGGYDYNKLAGTIYYEMDCGHRVYDTPAERRALSLGGRYSEPTNPGAHLSHRSYTLEAVAVDYIPWLMLIQEKHAALRSLRYGDPEPWMRYLQERECRFWDPQERPLVGKIKLNEEIKKDREGLKDRMFRGATVDKQAGSMIRGEAPHHWVVIRDWNQDGSSRLVYEGKVGLEEDVKLLIDQYEIDPRFVLIDSGYAANQVYQMCARWGWGAVKGEDKYYYTHLLPDETDPRIIHKVRRIYSPMQMVDAFEGDHGGAAGQYFIPLILYSKQGIRDRLAYVRASDYLKWEVPADVSEDYKRHMESEEQQEFVQPKTQEKYYKWVQVTKRNDLFVCECYQVLLAELAGLIGSGVETTIEPNEPTAN